MVGNHTDRKQSCQKFKCFNTGSKWIKNECFSNRSRMSHIEFEQTFGNLAKAENVQMFSIYTVCVNQLSEPKNSGNAQIGKLLRTEKSVCFPDTVSCLNQL